jgi:cell wall-associated NlpC family hydrolase
MIAEWTAKYVGLPFANRGRDRNGLDCWGLVRLVLRDVFDVELPSLDEKYERASDGVVVSHLVDMQRPILGAERTTAPHPGDVVLLQLRGLPCHVGVYVGDQCMLHVRRGTNAVVESLTSPRWSRRVEGYYRV